MTPRWTREQGRVRRPRPPARRLRGRSRGGRGPARRRRPPAHRHGRVDRPARLRDAGEHGGDVPGAPVAGRARPPARHRWSGRACTPLVHSPVRLPAPPPRRGGPMPHTRSVLRTVCRSLWWSTTSVVGTAGVAGSYLFLGTRGAVLLAGLVALLATTTGRLLSSEPTTRRPVPPPPLLASVAVGGGLAGMGPILRPGPAGL